MSQPHPRQHPGGSDRQFWQQQLMYKQLHELQRQQQLQQLDQGARQLISHNHLSAVTKPVALNQSAMVNDMATDNAPNYTWPNNLVRSLPPMLDGNPQMLVAGNMNWAQSASSPSMQNVANGLMIPNDQSQTMQSLRYIPQQDQSFYGMPVSNTRTSINQYHRLSRMSNDCDNLMSKTVENEPDKVSNQPSAFHNNQHFPARGYLQDRTSETAQNLQGKGSIVNTPGILNSDGTPGNFQQANNMQNSVQDQAFRGMQEQAFWPGNLQERVAEQVRTSHEVTSLDPTEEKFLYGNDDNWGPSFAGSLNSSSEGLLHGLPLANDCFGGFPSLQSGSWSALMQEAVQSSTSDNGVQEEWSGLDFHKMEQLMPKTSVISGYSGKQLSAWDDSNMQAASSLASRPLSLFNAGDAGPSLPTAPSFQHSYQSTYNTNNGVQNDASHLSSQISSGEGNNKQFHHGQKQKQLSECNEQVQMLENNGMWMDQTYQQQNNLTDLQNSIGSWTQQQTFTSSNVAVQSDSGHNDWNDNNAVEPSAVSNSPTDGSMWRVGATHVNPNSRAEKPFESDVGTSRVQTEGSFVTTYGSVMNSNSAKFTHESNQQVSNSQQVIFGKNIALDTCARTKDDGNVGGNHTEPSERRPQSWESTRKGTVESGNYQHIKKQPERVLEEAYASKNSNYTQESNILSGENESPTWIGKNPFVHRNVRPSSQPDQQSTGSIMSQNQTATLGMHRELSYPARSSHFQDTANPIFQESKSVDQAHVEKSDFNYHNLSNYITDATKRTLMGVEEPCTRDDIPVHASTSFDPSSINCSQNKNITQTSRSMLDLLPKVDHSRNSGTVAVSDNHAQLAVNAASPKSSTQVFGLRLAPPSQRQPSRAVFPSPSFISTGKSRQHNAEAGDKYQSGSSHAPIMQSLPQNDASQIETFSDMSDNKPKMASDFSKQLNSLLTSDPHIPYPGKQQQTQFTSGRTLMQHQQRQRHGHEVLHPSANFPVGNQTTLVRNVSLPQQPHKSLDDSVSGQSVLKSLPISDSGVPSSSLAPLADISEPSCLKSNSAERENNNKMIAGFHQVHNSNPFPETKSGLQPSLSGTSQQVGFSRMLHNVWTNLSAQQHLDGLQPPKLTPQILQSIISNNRDSCLWAPQTATEEADKGGTASSEVGTSYSDFEHQGGHQSKGASLNQPCSENMDAAPKTSMISQGEVAWRAPSDGNSNVSVSSLVRLHQQDLDKGKFGQDAIRKTQTSSAPTLSDDVRLTGQSLKTLDVQQKNYSLLHQIQTMRGGNSDQSRMLAGSLKGTDFTPNPHMDWNTGQRYISGQISGFNVPLDNKVGAASQSSFPSDVKMLNSTSMDNEEINTSTSAATAGNHELLNQMDTRGSNSAGNSVGGMEHTQITPQMASSWFKQYGSYKNGTVTSANFNGQWNPNASSHHHLFPKAPRSIDYNILVDQSSNSNNIGIHGQSSVSATIVAKELSSHNLGEVQRSKKRKSVTLELISWNKVVTQGQQRLQSISNAEIDWARAANRLFEKAEYESEAMEDSLSIIQPQRRMILTTQLMQQLIPAVPARMIRVEADIAYESVTFCVAKAALADACCMISCSEKDNGASLEDERRTSKKFKSSIGDHICSTLVESYIGRSKKVENDFLRLDRRASILDVRLECQELEKFSIVNRLGKFHGRPHTDAVEGSSVSEIGTRRMFIQRYVTALPVHGNLPEGVTYLPL